jgi:hypothetical protein
MNRKDGENITPIFYVSQNSRKYGKVTGHGYDQSNEHLEILFH